MSYAIAYFSTGITIRPISATFTMTDAKKRYSNRLGFKKLEEHRFPEGATPMEVLSYARSRS